MFCKSTSIIINNHGCRQSSLLSSSMILKGFYSTSSTRNKSNKTPRPESHVEIKKHFKSIKLQSPPNGLLVINKDAGYTSTDLTKVKVGHGGTLDLDADGVMVIGLGSGCKLLNRFLTSDKKYFATCEFGRETTTCDRSGEFIDNGSSSFKKYDHLTLDMINQKLNEPEFRGSIEQIPPIYSALRINGKRLSDLANQGVKVAPSARQVTIYDSKCTRLQGYQADYTMHVSSGFYVRSFVVDVAKALDSTCYITRLRREQVGPFTLDHCLRLEDLFTLPQQHQLEQQQNTEIRDKLISERIQKHMKDMEILLNNYTKITNPSIKLSNSTIII
ncbi:hypothetical protein DFA_10662 [Cavenderia fasciculata]|uniref:tRNA pseudouridine(55) synthase n=1 Tax=Cavenderia fasciculata TaxID=261658 RepID=F4QB17_CACFS|nr:uncharacterized protein DFA_10662 [Cavenderia fasciculata]EGG14789.1 hypothetical protein DFA_10662 [Cavenderia fasciculata]|eukprot:XP_004351305.1 hypothetical protein DFA_10662 [Cavenderia fasciculata]